VAQSFDDDSFALRESEGEAERADDISESILDPAAEPTPEPGSGYSAEPTSESTAAPDMESSPEVSGDPAAVSIADPSARLLSSPSVAATAVPAADAAEPNAEEGPPNLLEVVRSAAASDADEVNEFERPLFRALFCRAVGKKELHLIECGGAAEKDKKVHTYGPLSDWEPLHVSCIDATSSALVFSSFCIFSWCAQATSMEYVVAVCLVAEQCCPDLDGVFDTKAYRHSTSLIPGFRCGACAFNGVQQMVEVEPDESFASGFANHLADEHSGKVLGIFHRDVDLVVRVQDGGDKRAYIRWFSQRFQYTLENTVTDDMVQEEQRKYLAARAAAKAVSPLSIATAEEVPKSGEKAEPAPVTPPPPLATAGPTPATPLLPHNPMQAPVSPSPPSLHTSRYSPVGYLSVVAAILVRQPSAWEQPHYCREQDDAQVCHETEGSQGSAHHIQEGNRHTRQCTPN
jgi:hypothetical protein